MALDIVRPAESTAIQMKEMNLAGRGHYILSQIKMSPNLIVSAWLTIVDIVVEIIQNINGQHSDRFAGNVVEKITLR